MNARPLPYQGSALPLSYNGEFRCPLSPLSPWCPERKPRLTHGAGEGNRTLVVSLEGFCSTIELHPHLPASARLPPSAHLPATAPMSPSDGRLPKPSTSFWWRGKDSNLRRQSRQIYSLIPLTAREPLRTKPLIMLGFLCRVKRGGWHTSRLPPLNLLEMGPDPAMMSVPCETLVGLGASQIGGRFDRTSHVPNTRIPLGPVPGLLRDALLWQSRIRGSPRLPTAGPQK